MSFSRKQAEAILFEFTQSEPLRLHARAVEEAMRAYARWYGETDPARIETWGMVGLLHDFDSASCASAACPRRSSKRSARTRIT